MSTEEQIPEEVKLFLLEGYENLDSVEEQLVELEAGNCDEEQVNSIFRSIHTIKGNSGFLGFPVLEKLCHRAENVLDRVRSGEITPNSELGNALLQAVDQIRDILKNIEETSKEGEPNISDSLKSLEPFSS